MYVKHFVVTFPGQAKRAFPPC